MFSYDFIIVREILPEKGYLSILKEYVVVKSIPNLDYLFWKITLEIICNFKLCIYIEGMYARKLTLVWDQNVLSKFPKEDRRNEHCVLFISSNMNKESWTVIFFISERGWFQVPVFMFLQNDIINISKIIRHVILHIIRKWETADPASN